MSKKSILSGLLLAGSVILLAACGQQARQAKVSRLMLQFKPVLQKIKKLNKPRLITRLYIRIS